MPGPPSHFEIGGRNLEIGGTTVENGLEIGGTLEKDGRSLEKGGRTAENGLPSKRSPSQAL